MITKSGTSTYIKKTVVLTALCLLSGVAQAESFKEKFTENFVDPKDGKFDVSHYLSEVPMGFLPVPTIITEPAVGYGFGLGAIFFHESKEQKELRTEEGRPLKPNNITILGGAATENGTWFVGGGQVGYWREDSIRYKGFLGYGSVNLNFYSLPGLGDLPKPIELNMEGPAVFQELMFRLPNSKFFVGLRQQYTKVDTSFTNRSETPVLPPEWSDYLNKQFDLDASNSGLGLVAEYDSRDNPFNPQAGYYYSSNYTVFSDSLGGDINYDSFDVTALNYWNMSKHWNLGLRFQFDGVNAGNGQRLPPYVPPSINLRGVSMGRYQGERVAVAEVQLDYKITDRWKVGVFSGIGRAADRTDELSSADHVTTYGTGFRYLIAMRYGFVMGIDIARGPNEGAFYIQSGATWR